MSEFDPYRKWLGIKHSNRPVDHYELLGIKRFESDQTVIDAAVARRVADLQDVAAGHKHVEASQQILNEVAAARICLTDDAKRKIYDRQLVAGQTKPEQSPTTSTFAASKLSGKPSSTRPRAKKTNRGIGVYIVGYAVATVAAAGLAIGAFVVLNNRATNEVAELVRSDPETLLDAVDKAEEPAEINDLPSQPTNEPAQIESGGDLADADPEMPESQATNEDAALVQPDDIAGKQGDVKPAKPESQNQNVVADLPGEVAPEPDVLYSTSFEGVAPGVFQQQKLGEVEATVVGTASINSQFFKTGKQCLRLHGDANNSVTFAVPESAQGLEGISFQVERWTSKGPFECLIEVMQDESWNELAQLDRAIVVGARFRSYIGIPVSGGPTTAIRISVTAFPDSGLLIDDLSFHANPLTSPAMDAVKVPDKEGLAGLASYFELPGLEDTEPKKIDDLVINNQFLLGAKLLLSSEASKNTLTFEMARSANDKQRWVLSQRKGSRGTPVEVANFWKAGSELWFQWLTTAKEDENVNYLRNGVLKLETPDGKIGWLNLRKPILFRDFSIPKDETSIKTKVELPWMPAPKSVVIEIMSFPRLPSHCIPEYVGKDPGRMYFTRDESKAFVWLEISAGKRVEYSFEAELKANVQGRVKPATLNLLADYHQFLARAAAATKATLDATKDKGKRASLAKAYQASATMAAASQSYETIISQVYGKHIPVAVYFEVEGHRVLVARTPGVEDFKP